MKYKRYPIWSSNSSTVSNVKVCKSHELDTRCTVRLRYGWLTLLVHRSVVAGKCTTSLSLGLTIVSCFIVQFGDYRLSKVLEGRFYFVFNLTPNIESLVFLLCIRAGSLWPKNIQQHDSDLWLEGTLCYTSLLHSFQ